MEGFFFLNVTKVTASSHLIIVLGKDEFSFANVSVFWGWGGGWRTTQRLTFSNYMLWLWTIQFHLQLNLVSFRIDFFFLSKDKENK